MRWRHANLPSLLACLLFVSPAGSAAPAADLEILRRVVKTYTGLERYLFQGAFHVELRTPSRPKNEQTAPFLVAVDGKGRIRDEVTSGPATGMIVSDGKQTVIYNAQLGQYVREAGGADSALAKMASRGAGGNLLARLSAAATGVVATQRLPNEAVPLDGGTRDCIVLDVTYQPPAQAGRVTEEPRRYWIDARTHLVLRMRTRLRAEAPQLGGVVEQDETISFRRALTNPVLHDSLWVFRAPPSAHEVSEFSGGPEDPASAFTGKPAIDFSLKDIHGKAHTLKNLRGKTVLLDFWATWCGPCRITMPQVAKIHQEYKTRGVEVMSINVGESAKKAGDYMTKNRYLFTTLLDEDRQVSSQYRINGIPTLVVIDAAGKVTDYLVGVRDDVALRAALKKAGVK
jgi:thiol-disulfide isomerase/thioredoxin/outer membrane lipoprotein-sorting protein